VALKNALIGTGQSAESNHVPESAGALEILYQDDDVVVVDKPAAMLTHIHQFDRMTPNVAAVLGRTLGRPVHVVHRLDRMTSGALVMALNRDSARHLSLQFRDRLVRKSYLAIVRGHCRDSGTVETPLGSAAGDHVEAYTEYHTIARGAVPEAVGRYPEAWFSLVRVGIRTGRKHQVRRHMHSIDHPVLGDARHGDKSYNRWAATRFGTRTLYLRATELEFLHPVRDCRLRVELRVPQLWLETLSILFPTLDTPNTWPASNRIDTMQERD